MTILKPAVRIDHGLSVAKPFEVKCLHFPQAHSSLTVSDMHYALQIGVVLSGCLETAYSAHTMRVLPGQAWWASCWEPHGVRPAKAHTTHLVISILLDALGNIDPFGQFRWLSPFSVEPRCRPQPLDKHTRKTVVSLATEIRKINQTRPRAWQLCLWFKIHELILKLCSQWRFPSELPSPNYSEVSRVMPAVQLIQSNTPISLKQAAQACHISVSRFSEIFREIMGISFGKFALRARVAGAAYQLKTSHEPIKALALKWGFTDASHFHNVFFRYFHCTPVKYRQQTNSGGDWHLMAPLPSDHDSSLYSRHFLSAKIGLKRVKR